MIGRLLVFLAGILLLGLLLIGAAWQIWPEARERLLPCSLTALALCLVPTTLTLAWSFWGLKQRPQDQLITALGGTGVRLFVVLGVGLALTQIDPYFQEQQRSFWFWVAVFYVTTLAAEMMLIVSSQNLTQPPSQ